MIARSSVIWNKIGRTAEILGDRIDFEVGVDNRLWSFGYNHLEYVEDK